MADSPTTLADLVDDAIFLSTETQAFIDETWGGLGWNVDMSGPSFVFASAPPTVLRAHFVGSAAPGPNSWLWAWNNVNGFPEASVALAANIRDEWPDLRETTTAELPLEHDDLPLRLTLAAKTASGRFAHVDVDAGNGTRIWILLQGAEVEALPVLTVPRLLRVLSEGISTTAVADHRRALDSYARMRPLELAWTGDVATIALPDGAVAVTLDAEGRIGSMSAGGQADATTAAPEAGEAAKKKRWWQRG